MALFGKSKYKEAAKLRASNSLKIVQDCVNLINNTVNPEVYFKRYDMLKYHMDILVELEPHVRFSGELPSVSLKAMEENEQMSIKNFINRYYDSVRAKTIKLKTKKAKLKHIQEFYDNLVDYFPWMDESNIELVENLYDIACTTIMDE